MSWILRMSRFLSAGLLVALGGEIASANNVQVRLEGSYLTIVGDNLANSVVFEKTTAGIVVTGRNGTRVNGAASVFLRGAVINAAFVDMGAGNDAVTLRNLDIANDLFVYLGAGDDRLDTSGINMIGANATIEGAENNDTIMLTGMVVLEDFFLDGGLGVLSTSLTDLDVGKSLTVVSDEAADAIRIVNCGVAEMVSVESKGGNDAVVVSGLMAFGAFITTDAGADRVTMSNVVTLEDVGVFTGVGDDAVSLSAMSIGKSITVSTDAGNDNVSGSVVAAAADAVFEGGAGVDTITDRQITGRIKKDIKEFEVRR